MMHQRLKRILLWAGCIGFAGVIYGVFVYTTAIAIPCLFHLITGWMCPGCGVTRMMLAIFQLDWKEAYQWHPMLMLQLPFLVTVLISNVVRYVRNGKWHISRLENVVLYVCVALLICYGIYRNIIG